MFSVYPLVRVYLCGTEASGLYEARLGKEHLGGETHVFAAAYREDEFPEIAAVCDHIVFNSVAQLHKFRICFRKEAGPADQSGNTPRRSIPFTTPARRAPGSASRPPRSRARTFAA
jgi:carboxynorspermidine decarboxylase